jgi:glycosyltransferase involved in cell wall biosynthesis
MKEHKPKIAIISIRNSYGFGGVFSTLKVVHDFCAQYFDPTVFYLSYDPEISAHLRRFSVQSSNRAASFFGMQCVEIGARWAFWEPGHYSFTQPQWQAALKEYDYFFVVSATPLAGHPLALLDKKFVMWISTSYDQDRTERVKQLTGIRWLINKLAQPAMHRIERFVLRKAAHIIALSTYSRAEFLNTLQAPKKELSVCGFPLDPSHTPTIAKNFAEKTIIAVGRFSDPRKNIALLFAAFTKIHAAVPDAHLYVIGAKPESADLAPYEGSSILNAISFVGQVSAADLRRFYQEASLMLVTSHQEGFGIAAMEGAYFGTPIVSTDCGGPRDFVISGYNGFIVNLNDSEAMARAAIQLLNNPHLAAEFSHNGHHLAEAMFKQSKVFSHFKHALTDVYPELAQHFAAVDAVAPAAVELNSPMQQEAL